MLKKVDPYFMRKKEWFFYDIKTFRYQLTDLGKKITEVADSYKKFYDEQLESYVLDDK